MSSASSFQDPGSSCPVCTEAPAWPQCSSNCNLIALSPALEKPKDWRGLTKILIAIVHSRRSATNHFDRAKPPSYTIVAGPILGTHSINYSGHHRALNLFSEGLPFRHPSLPFDRRLDTGSIEGIDHQFQFSRGDIGVDQSYF